MELTRLVYWVE